MAQGVRVLEGVNVHEGGVYLICLDKPFKGTKHYIGFALNNIGGRMYHHLKNRGSTYMAAVNKAGISWKCTRTWPGESRTFERSLKNRKQSAMFCPVCRDKKVKEKKRRKKELERDRVRAERAIIRDLKEKGIVYYLQQIA